MIFKQNIELKILKFSLLNFVVILLLFFSQKSSSNKTKKSNLSSYFEFQYNLPTIIVTGFKFTFYKQKFTPFVTPY